MATIEEQLAEVYAVIDELDVLGTRLRNAADEVLATYKGETPNDHE